MKEKDLMYQLYWLMCRDCPNAKSCHDDCVTCEEYDEELERLLKENK